MFAIFTLWYNQSPADEYVLLMDNYSHLNVIRKVGLGEAGWTYRRIAAHVGHNVSMVCRCFQQWSVEHSYARRLGSGRPRSTDARQDRRSCGCLNSIQGKHPSTCYSCCVTTDHWEPSDCSRTKITCASDDVVKEWNGVLLSSVMRLGSGCMRVLDVHV